MAYIEAREGELGNTRFLRSMLRSTSAMVGNLAQWNQSHQMPSVPADLRDQGHPEASLPATVNHMALITNLISMR